jgi:hypothetical protein
MYVFCNKNMLMESKSLGTQKILTHFYDKVTTAYAVVSPPYAKTLFFLLEKNGQCDFVAFIKVCALHGLPSM